MTRIPPLRTDWRTAARPACLGVLLVLTSCSGHQLARNLGLARDSPDEFAVTTRAPLAMPTTYDLPTPTPGARRPQEPAADLQAAASLTPSIELNNRGGTETPGQAALVTAAGPAAPPDIRELVDAEAKKANRSGGLGSSLAFWAPAPIPGRALDPVAEAARLKTLGIGQRNGASAITPAAP